MSEALKLKSRKNQPQGLDFSWCRISDVFLTLNTENIDSYKLKHLVEQFSLVEELLV